MTALGHASSTNVLPAADVTPFPSIAGLFQTTRKSKVCPTPSTR